MGRDPFTRKKRAKKIVFLCLFSNRSSTDFFMAHNVLCRSTGSFLSISKWSDFGFEFRFGLWGGRGSSGSGSASIHPFPSMATHSIRAIHPPTHPSMRSIPCIPSIHSSSHPSIPAHSHPFISSCPCQFPSIPIHPHPSQPRRGEGRGRLRVQRGLMMVLCHSTACG